MPKQMGRPIGVGMTPSKTELGKFLRSRRLELGLSQFEVAKRVGMDRVVYSGYERGEYLYLQHAERMARALQCDLSQLQALLPERSWMYLRAEPKTELGKFLRSRRDELGLTQRQLARRLGVTWQHVSNLELGNTPLSSSGSRLEKLAKALKLDVATLGALKPRRKRRKILTQPGSLGEFIAKRRVELSLSQAQLGLRAQVSPAIVSLIERGGYRPSPQILAKVSAALDCEIPSELLQS